MNWVNSGICFLSDIIRNSNIDDDIIFSKLQNRTNCFSELMTVKKSIPNDMIRSVSDSECIPNFCDLSFHVPYKQDCINVFNLSTKDIYSILLDPRNVPRKSEEYWIKKLGEDINFNLWYKNLFLSKFIPRQVQVFNWRIFNNQVLTGGILRFMKFSEKCAVCKCNDIIEDRIHLFVTCESLKEIWKFVDDIFSKLNFEPLGCYNRIIGFYEECENIEIKNMILGICRWTIWKRRCCFRYERGYTPKLSLLLQFKYDLKSHLNLILQSRYSSKIDNKICTEILCECG